MTGLDLAFLHSISLLVTQVNGNLSPVLVDTKDTV